MNNIADKIDHTLLKAFAKKEDIKKLCDEAIKYQFKSVCINPAWVSTAKEYLHNTNVLVCTVIGFPLGANTVETKVFETTNAITNGADEIDMVINIGKVKMGEYGYILNEIDAVVKAAAGKTVKVIIETCYLTEDEKIQVCQAAKIAKASFVKTSTGFATGGANVSDVKLMKETVNDYLEVKASGGIKNYEAAKALLDAGATRLGTSNGIDIIKGDDSNGDSAY